MDKIKILNINILAITEKKLLERLNEGVLLTPNVDHLVRLQKDKEFYTLYQQTEWVICDSTVIQLFSKCLPETIPETIPGSSFFPAYYMHHKDDMNCRIFLLGAMEGVAEIAKDKINKKVGRDIIVGSYSPPLGFEASKEENIKIKKMIEQSKATTVLVGVGCPKQEKWIFHHKDEILGVKLWLALGATIDFEAGNKKRAPKIWRTLRMEWLYRMCQEPKRISKRVFQDLIIFYYWGMQLLGKYNDPFMPGKGQIRGF